jgi:hypothetical protein
MEHALGKVSRLLTSFMTGKNAMRFGFIDAATLRRKKLDVGFWSARLFTAGRLLTIILLSMTIFSVVQINIQPVSGSGLGSIHGWVSGLNYDGNVVALPGANITAKAAVIMSTVSRMNGEYQMYLPPGIYTVTVSANGRSTYLTGVSVSNGLTTEINFILKRL